ncbi:MAG: M28 family peptidase, partial [Desulfobacteraceae bacterium]
NPVFLLFTDAEEAGLLGAEAFTAEHPWARQVGVTVNLEARGTSGPSLLFETSENNAWLIKAYAKAVSRPLASSLFFQIYRNMPNSTDLSVFKRNNIPGLNLAFVDHSVYYHTPLDDLNHLDPGSLQHQGDTALALVRKLADMDLRQPAHGNAVYSDLLGLTVLWWPEPWTVPLAMVISLLLLAVTVSLVRAGQVSIRSIGWGLLAWFAGILISVLFSIGFMWVARKLTGTQSPWYAYPLPMRLALWSGALLVGEGIAILFSRRAQFWGLGLGAWLWWAILSTASAFMLPAVSVYFLAPAGIAALGLIIVRFTGLRYKASAAQAACIAGALTAGLFWMQLALLLERVMGFGIFPVIMSALALTVSTLMPFFINTSRSKRWPLRVLAAAAAVMLVSTVAALTAPHYSEKRPRPLNIIHFEDRDAGTAHWVAVSFSGDLPDALRRAGRFIDKSEGVFPWSIGPCFVAKAEALAVPAPELVRISEESVNGERIVKTRLRSPREGNGITLIVSKKASLKAINMEGKPISFSSNTDREKYWYFGCVNPPRDGCNVEIHLGDNNPVEVMILDESFGLSAGGETLIQARAPLAVPCRDGDKTMILRHDKL